jgi:hypothetical protein
MATGIIYVFREGKVLTNRSWGYADYFVQEKQQQNVANNTGHTRA